MKRTQLQENKSKQHSMPLSQKWSQTPTRTGAVTVNKELSSPVSPRHIANSQSNHIDYRPNIDNLSDKYMRLSKRIGDLRSNEAINGELLEAIRQKDEEIRYLKELLEKTKISYREKLEDTKIKAKNMENLMKQIIDEHNKTLKAFKEVNKKLELEKGKTEGFSPQEKHQFDRDGAVMGAQIRITKENNKDVYPHQLNDITSCGTQTTDIEITKEVTAEDASMLMLSAKRDAELLAFALGTPRSRGYITTSGDTSLCQSMGTHRQYNNASLPVVIKRFGRLYYLRYTRHDGWLRWFKGLGRRAPAGSILSPRTSTFASSTHSVQPVKYNYKEQKEEDYISLIRDFAMDPAIRAVLLGGQRDLGGGEPVPLQKPPYMKCPVRGGSDEELVNNNPLKGQNNGHDRESNTTTINPTRGTSSTFIRDEISLNPVVGGNSSLYGKGSLAVLISALVSGGGPLPPWRQLVIEGTEGTGNDLKYADEGGILYPNASENGGSYVTNDVSPRGMDRYGNVSKALFDTGFGKSFDNTPQKTDTALSQLEAIFTATSFGNAIVVLKRVVRDTTNSSRMSVEEAVITDSSYLGSDSVFLIAYPKMDQVTNEGHNPQHLFHLSSYQMRSGVNASLFGGSNIVSSREGMIVSQWVPSAFILANYSYFCIIPRMDSSSTGYGFMEGRNDFHIPQSVRRLNPSKRSILTQYDNKHVIDIRIPVGVMQLKGEVLPQIDLGLLVYFCSREENVNGTSIGGNIVRHQKTSITQKYQQSLIDENIVSATAVFAWKSVALRPIVLNTENGYNDDKATSHDHKIPGYRRHSTCVVFTSDEIKRLIPKYHHPGTIEKEITPRSVNSKQDTAVIGSFHDVTLILSIKAPYNVMDYEGDCDTTSSSSDTEGDGDVGSQHLFSAKSTNSYINGSNSNNCDEHSEYIEFISFIEAPNLGNLTRKPSRDMSNRVVKFSDSDDTSLFSSSGDIYSDSSNHHHYIKQGGRDWIPKPLSLELPIGKNAQRTIEVVKSNNRPSGLDDWGKERIEEVQSDDEKEEVIRIVVVDSPNASSRGDLRKTTVLGDCNYSGIMLPSSSEKKRDETISMQNNTKNNPYIPARQYYEDHLIRNFPTKTLPIQVNGRDIVSDGVIMEDVIDFFTYGTLVPGLTMKRDSSSRAVEWGGSSRSSDSRHSSLMLRKLRESKQVPLSLMSPFLRWVSKTVRLMQSHAYNVTDLYSNSATSSMRGFINTVSLEWYNGAVTMMMQYDFKKLEMLHKVGGFVMQGTMIGGIRRYISCVQVWLDGLVKNTEDNILLKVNVARSSLSEGLTMTSPLSAISSPDYVDSESIQLQRHCKSLREWVNGCFTHLYERISAIGPTSISRDNNPCNSTTTVVDDFMSIVEEMKSHYSITTMRFHQYESETNILHIKYEELLDENQYMMGALERANAEIKETEERVTDARKALGTLQESNKTIRRAFAEQMTHQETLLEACKTDLYEATGNPEVLDWYKHKREHKKDSEGLVIEINNSIKDKRPQHQSLNCDSSDGWDDICARVIDTKTVRKGPNKCDKVSRSLRTLSSSSVSSRQSRKRSVNQSYAEIHLMAHK